MPDETLHVKTTLSADDHASPVVRKFIENVRALERSVKRFNSTFSSVGSDKLFGRLAEKIKRSDDLVSKSAESYQAQWNGAYAARLRDAQQFHRQLDRLERQSTRRVAEQRAVDRGYHAGGRTASMPRGISPTTAAIVSGGLFAGVASAFKQRMQAEAAETKAQIFGGLSKAEIKSFRSDIGDKLALKFGESAFTIVDVFTESLKAGFTNDVSKKLVKIGRAHV